MSQQIFELIPKVMADVGSVGKDAKNIYDKYKYRSIDAVYNALQPALSKHQVFLAPTVLETTEEKVLTDKGKTQVRVVLRVKYTAYAPDSSSVECVVVGEGVDRGDKAHNKALTAAFKYMLFQLFCISYEGMTDADSDSPALGNSPDVIKGGKYRGKLASQIGEDELNSYIKEVTDQINEKGVAAPKWFTELCNQIQGESNGSK